MNFFIVLLVFILGGALLLAVELLRAGRASGAGACAELWNEVAAAKDYGPVERLFDPADRELVAEQPALAKKLRGSRRRALRLFLRALRADFLKAWALCRILAPISPDEGLAFRLARHWFVFHAVYAAALLHATLGFGSVKSVEAGKLVETVRALQTGAADLVQAHQRLAISASAA